MGRPPNLQMLIGVGGVFNSPELFVFDQGAMHRATGMTCVGAGESSLIRYLAENLYSTSMTLERSEEHTSELQSRQYLVCRLLLEKKKKSRANPRIHTTSI